MGMIMGYPGEPNVIMEVLIRGGHEGHSRRRKCDERSRDQRDRECFEDATLLALKMEEYASHRSKIGDSP